MSADKKYEDVEGSWTLPNGRVYKVSYTGTPYQEGEYPTGGYYITGKELDGSFRFVDYSPDKECVRNFLKAAERLKPLETIVAEVQEIQKQLNQLK